MLDTTSKPALGFIQPPIQWVSRSSTLKQRQITEIINQVLNLQQSNSKPEYEHQHTAVTTLLSGSEISTQTEDDKRRITARELSLGKERPT